ncbi:MAG TPA: S28 family serine protease, partial [Polyangiaceae bacterium]|nr:S28 family serine protease [Polyangiaceae bacterium]
MRTTLALFFTPALALLALTACGDSETSPGTTASSATGAGGAAGSATSSSAGGSGGEAGGGGSGGSGGAGGTADIDILEQLNAIPGVTATEEISAIDGYRYFMIDFEQPVDHADPDGQHFTQRLLLHHKDQAAPFVLASTGYYLWLPSQYLEEPADLLDANQLIVEHRYFYPSRPDPADWTLLNIAQAASDHHRIVEVLRPIYEGKWISTGVSKGGMTSIYHRRFFPGDVDGTVAYVAPHSDGIDDPRYAEFLGQVGDAACRQKLKDFQREVLIRRSSMLPRLESLASKYNVTFNIIGIEPSLESSVIGLGFAFWQY